MKKLVAAILLSLPLTTSAEVLTDSIPVCLSLTHWDQVMEAKKRNDIRAMRYLMEEGHCFPTKEGIEYSVIDVNYPEDIAEWVKLRVYTEHGAVEVYTLYGFVK